MLESYKDCFYYYISKSHSEVLYDRYNMYHVETVSLGCHNKIA